jgi:hypothetical protein
VLRRLLVIPFERTTPREERQEHIGRKIVEREADLLLDWAVPGASRVLQRKGSSEPPSCMEAKRDWLSEADVVVAWPAQAASAVNNLVQRVISAGKGVMNKRDNRGWYLVGLVFERPAQNFFPAAVRFA